MLRGMKGSHQTVTRCNALNGVSHQGGLSRGNRQPDRGGPNIDYSASAAGVPCIRIGPTESLLIKRVDCDCQGGRRSQRPSRAPCQCAATLQLRRLRSSVSRPAFAPSLLKLPCSDGQDFTAPHGPKAARKYVLLPPWQNPWSCLGLNEPSPAATARSERDFAPHRGIAPRRQRTPSL
jgi:hypothetical protein